MTKIDYRLLLQKFTFNKNSFHLMTPAVDLWETIPIDKHDGLKKKLKELIYTNPRPKFDVVYESIISYLNDGR